VTLDGLALARSTVDRAVHRRTDDAWLAEAWADPETRVLVVRDGQVPVEHGDSGPALVWVSPAAAPEGERYLLGVDAVAYFALAAAGTAPDDSVPLAGLREVGALLDARDAGLVVEAIALANWHAAHGHCSRCGAPTVVTAAGHIRQCPRDGSEHFPRTDPAVIRAVVDAADRVLLGRQHVWPEGRFSTLAGFVEPGESLEQAVRREVMEEARVLVGSEPGDVRYLGSQPWPFPSSLMVGFVARAVSTEIETEGDELAEARWFSRMDLEAAVESGAVRLPPRVSIARRLIEHWYGRELTESGNPGADQPARLRPPR
jgi:NAD+ diphosphatase